MLIPFGILSAAGVSGVVPGDYELISTTILGTATASVTFSSLGDYASTYKHLQIRTVARGNNASQNVAMDLRLNGDTSANYALHLLEGTGSIVYSFAQTSTDVIFLTQIPANSFTANGFGAATTDILDAYSTTKNKTVRTLAGYGGSVNSIQMTSGHRRSTDSTTSIQVFSRSGSFIAGSRFSLYGIKG
jgi:hypothetical protein